MNFTIDSLLSPAKGCTCCKHDGIHSKNSSHADPATPHSDCSLRDCSCNHNHDCLEEHVDDSSADRTQKESQSKIHNHDHSHSHNHDHNLFGQWILPSVSFILLISGIVLQHLPDAVWFHYRAVELIWFICAFIPVGLPVFSATLQGFREKDFFNEFSLMTIASIGAFCIGEYAEGVAVMLFYCLGEMLQDKAVDKVKNNISRLLELKATTVKVIEGDQIKNVSPEEVITGSKIFIGVGERLSLDGKLMDGAGNFDTSALTGESMPKFIQSGEEVLAGMIPLETPATILTTKEYKDSSLAKIIELVRNAQENKAGYVKFISRFAKVYTPAVFVLAVLLVALPALYSLIVPSFNYVFSEWFYRALVFLVISCPCALVISVPLGYFIGIGVASRNGVLVKGGNYLDLIRKANVYAFDKTGTLTTGKLEIKEISTISLSPEQFISIIAGLEQSASHPLAKTICQYAKEHNIYVGNPENIKEMPGYGITGFLDDKMIVCGNRKLFQENNISLPPEIESKSETMILCGINNQFAGFISFRDRIRNNARQMISELKKDGIKETILLSGDNASKTKEVADFLYMDKGLGELLPADKSREVRIAAGRPDSIIAYVGDGINDAPVLATSNIGIAMGGMGSDLAVENADIIIQDDNLSKIPLIRRIGRTTHTIIIENITFAIVIKVVVLLLGAMGNLSLWAAVFADVGVSLIAILNALRIFLNYNPTNNRHL